MTEHRLPPIHPGEILLEEFLKPMNISQYRLAKDISVPARRINEIVQGNARHQCGHGAQIVPLFRVVRTVLDEPPGPL